jgi:Flp pilus assembly CpaF family ATPase
VDLVVHLMRQPDGGRVVAAISQVIGAEGGVYMLREVFNTDAPCRRKEVI